MGKGWLGASLIKLLRTAQKKLKSTTFANLAPGLAAWGPGARLRAPVGSRGKAPGGSPGGEAPGSSCVFCFCKFLFFF